MASCPFCDETIESGLATCPHCESSLPVVPEPAPTTTPVPRPVARPVPVEQRPRSSNTLIWLLVIGGIVLAGICLFCILAALLLPAVQQAREAARRTQCRGNLTAIGLALHNYHDMYGTFPPAYIPDTTGKPMHSWRVLILPFVDQTSLHAAYDFNKPWDSPENMSVTRNTPSVFRCPSAPGRLDTTHYVVITGRDTCFDGAKGIKIRGIPDGTSSTLLVVEAHDSGIHWSEPRDYDMPTLTAPGGLNSRHPG